MRSASAIIAVTLGLLLAGCATLTKTPHLNPPPPAVAVRAALPKSTVVKPPLPAPMPAPRACVPKGFARAPAYPDSDAALRDAGGAADRYQLLAAGRVLRALRLAELERAIDACR